MGVFSVEGVTSFALLPTGAAVGVTCLCVFHMVLLWFVLSNRTCVLYSAPSLDQQRLPPWSWHPSSGHDGGLCDVVQHIISLFFFFFGCLGRVTSVDPSLGHGQHPRQRGHDDRHEGEVHVVLCFLQPRSAAALHSRDELFSKHIEPEPAPEDPVDWATVEASDDEDDAPLPDLIDMPLAPASARPMSNLERCIALRLVATRRSHRPKKLPLHHITSSLYCLTCPLSRVSLFKVSCPGSQRVTRRSPSCFFAMASKSVDTR